MVKISNAEYLAKPLLEDLNFIIDKDFMQITSASTRHAEARRHEKLSKTALLTLYSNVIKMARDRNLQIGFRNHYRREVNGMWDEYELCYETAYRLFEDILKQAKVVESRGLHYGTCDDIELEKLQNLCNEYNKNFWRSAVIFKMEAILSALEDMRENIQHSDINGLVGVYL